MGLHWCTEFPWALVPMVHPIRYPMELTIWERPMGKSHGKLDASRRKHDAPMGNLVGNPMGSPVGTKIHLMSSLMGPVAPPWKFYGKLDASHGTFHGTSYWKTEQCRPYARGDLACTHDCCTRFREGVSDGEALGEVSRKNISWLLGRDVRHAGRACMYASFMRDGHLFCWLVFETIHPPVQAITTYGDPLVRESRRKVHTIPQLPT